MHAAMLRWSALLTLSTTIAASPSAGCDLDTQAGAQTLVLPFASGTYEHAIAVPDGFAGPRPLLLYLHGWGGDSGECGATCGRATDRGFVTVALTGVGPSGWSSWNSPGAGDPATCAPGTPDFCHKYASCDCGEPACDWATCEDSTSQILEVYEAVVAAYCVDLDRVWAMGCSNGGMMVHGLASDDRSAPLLAGVATAVGLPHAHHNRKPATPMHYVGYWGASDRVVPPLSNTDDEDMSVDTDGWYYSTARNTTDLWAASMRCGAREAYAATSMDCTAASHCDGGADVVECLFDGGHRCGRPYMDDLVFDFMEPRSRAAATPTAAPTDGACDDDAGWFFKKKYKGCEWVAKNAGRRCEKSGATAACPSACDVGDCCDDDATWYSKKTNRDCVWVAKKPNKRCKKKSAGNLKIKATDGYSKACGTCREPP